MNKPEKKNVFHPEGPQPLVPERKMPTPFPVDALGPLKDAVVVVQQIAQAPVAIPAQSALGVCSLAVQGHVDVETLAGVSVASLFLMTIAESGERKTTCDKLMMEPVFAFEREQLGQYLSKKTEYEFDAAVWKRKSDALAREDLSAADLARERAALGDPPVPPRMPDRIVTEPTFEGLTELFDIGQPSLALFSDEGGQFLGGFAMGKEQRQKTMSAFNGLWQGASLKRTRKGDGHRSLYGRRLAMHLMVQPLVAKQFLRDDMASDSGLLARFLVSEPESTIGKRPYRNPNEVPREALDAFEGKLTGILAIPLPMDERTGELKPRVLALSEDARNALIVYADKVEADQARGGSLENIRATASKSAEQAARIAGVMAAFDDISAGEVSLEHMNNAIELATYYVHEALRFSEEVQVAERIAFAETIRAWLIDKWEDDYVMPRDVQRDGPNKCRGKASDIKMALDLLEEYGWLVRMPVDHVHNGKPRAALYKVVRNQPPELT